jgi:UDP-N-acetylmuramate: L-alanyl-gamma-D-glutamyl-meso-diaminopimelate ligase
VTETTEDAFYFTIEKNGSKIGTFSTKLLGIHNVENCIGVIAMCDILGFDLEAVGKAVASFNGVKVRLELLGKTKNGATVYNDIAHSPVKAKASLEALRSRFATKKIVSVFDPHASSLSDRKSLAWYSGSFDNASVVILPAVPVKKSTPKEDRVYGKDILESIQKTQPNAIYMPLDHQIIDYLQELKDDSVIVFMSSGGWRGIVDALEITK